MDLLEISLLSLSTIISLNDSVGASSSLRGFSPSEALPSELLACFQLATHADDIKTNIPQEEGSTWNSNLEVLNLK